MVLLSKNFTTSHLSRLQQWTYVLCMYGAGVHACVCVCVMCVHVCVCVCVCLSERESVCVSHCLIHTC